MGGKRAAAPSGGAFPPRRRVRHRGSGGGVAACRRVQCHRGWWRWVGRPCRQQCRIGPPLPPPSWCTMIVFPSAPPHHRSPHPLGCIPHGSSFLFLLYAGCRRPQTVLAVCGRASGPATSPPPPAGRPPCHRHPHPPARKDFAVASALLLVRSGCDSPPQRPTPLPPPPVHRGPPSLPGTRVRNRRPPWATVGHRGPPWAIVDGRGGGGRHGGAPFCKDQLAATLAAADGSGGGLGPVRLRRSPLPPPLPCPRHVQPLMALVAASGERPSDDPAPVSA